jgi:ubiquinone/menaquinone biosynthesis C-methylase UbiE
MTATTPDDAAAHAEADERWEHHAEWWQREFTEGADPEYEEQILPLAVELLAGRGRVLEVGTGEGQVARAVAVAQGAGAGGAETGVVGVDLAGAQIAEAARRGGGPAYARASATALPFAPGSFDAATACLVLEHVDDLDGAIAEMARVVRPGGRVVLFLNHPLLQTPGSGWIDDHVLDPPEQYWRVGPYLGDAVTIEEVSKGVFIRFVHRPLSSYVNTMSDHGLLLERMVEPPPPPGFLARATEYLEAATIPRLLVLVARAVGSDR